MEDDLSMDALLKLPWQVQIIFVGGYLGYVVAYNGRRSSHKAMDSLAIILCFGGISLISFNVMQAYFSALPPIKSAVSAFAAMGTAVVAAVLWRRYIRDVAQTLIRWSSKSEEDGLSTGWETLIQTQGLNYSQINVTLTNGTILESFPLGDFNHLPNGPCILGGDGSVALYVTHIQESNSDRRDANKLTSEDGARITFVPAAQIREVDLRRARR